MTNTPNKGAGTPSSTPAVVPTKPPPFQIKSRAKRDESRYIKIAVYGDYGSGKTYLAGTAAEVESMRDVLVVSAESGELTLDSVDDHGFENIDSVDVKNFIKVAEVYDFLKLHCQYRDAGDIEKLKKLQARMTGVPAEEIADEDVRQYRTVIIDSLTEVEIYCMNQLLGISDSTGLQEETQSAEWAEYKKQFHMVQRLVRAYRDLPMNVIMIIGRQYTQDEQKKMLFTLNLTGKLASQVQGFMDIVGYLVTGAADEKGNLPRRLYIQPTGRFAAKSRFSNFKAPHIDNPSMKVILTQVGLLKGEVATKPQTK